MSQAAIAVREENREGIRSRSSGANSNMVTNIKDHITCTRSMENYTSQDSKVGIVSFPCDFDHMYASMSEGMVSSKEKNEYKHLKEICLQHLDLIQQQSELIAKQEKQIQTLRQEKEKLKQRIQRLDRRSGHSKTNCDSENTETKVGRGDLSSSRRNASPITSETGKSPRHRNNRSFSPKERSRSPLQWRRSAQRRQSEDGGASVSSECEMRDDSSTTTVSQRSAQRGKRSGGPGRKRQRGKRSISSGSREVNADEEPNEEVPLSDTRESKRVKKDETELSSGAVNQTNAVLTTSEAYYTATGSSEPGWSLSEMCIETEPEPELTGDVLETPQWRVKVYTSLYSMEGTENLDDEVFLKRHHRLEVDERRRKRWDVQRIREQRHIEKLKQRELQSNALGGSKGDGQSEEPVSTLWPIPDDAQYLEVADELPVAAFGLPVSKFTPSEFSLPWLQSGSSDDHKPTGKKPLRNRRTASGSASGRKRIVRRGGHRGSHYLSRRRGDGAERK
ncbi:male-specific lethal 1 homolog isoform X1 [Frankliniella occidentalis]|uniref:Male-specific lethal 1 homolog isoform X1 n=1 Tax=Frankliniella occidentalis TaxID=133901 RepID=A0A6J1SHL2_FRAOC|nr:male-specific lethal 1 homolog isoform X1 [Frankliniella occidentalis]